VRVLGGDAGAVGEPALDSLDDHRRQRAVRAAHLSGGLGSGSPRRLLRAGGDARRRRHPDRGSASLPTRPPHGDVPPRPHPRRPVNRLCRVNPRRARPARLSGVTSALPPAARAYVAAGLPAGPAARSAAAPARGSAAATTVRTFYLAPRDYDARPRITSTAITTTTTPISSTHSQPRLPVS